MMDNRRFVILLGVKAREYFEKYELCEAGYFWKSECPRYRRRGSCEGCECLNVRQERRILPIDTLARMLPYIRYLKSIYPKTARPKEILQALGKEANQAKAWSLAQTLSSLARKGLYVETDGKGNYKYKPNPYI